MFRDAVTVTEFGFSCANIAAAGTKNSASFHMNATIADGRARSYAIRAMRQALILVLLAALPAWPQPPEVRSDRRVVFRFRAPNAKEVLLAREGAPRVPMTKGADGVWTVTTEPLDPDYYAYTFAADGVSLIDPANPATRPNLLNTQSVLHVPGPLSLAWEMNAVPHGAVHHHFYRSQVAGDDRDFYVYTPPGYDPRGATLYPTLYLQHGYSGDARGWVEGAPANVILDNLIAQGKARPMLLVMALGYAVPDMLRPAGPDAGMLQRNCEKFRDALVREVIPEVEKTYRVAKGRESRAIAGLSMGGTEALYAGLNAPETFAWVGSFSAGGWFGGHDATFPALDAKANATLRLLWIACGTEDPQLEPNRKFRDWLAAKGVKFTPVETPGRHTWMVWRRNLAAFAPLLFR